MMTLFVPAHSSADGNHVLSKSMTATWRTTGGSVVQTIRATEMTDQCYKSPGTSGAYSSTFPGFRKPTRWVRSVIRTEDLSGGAVYDFRSGSTRYVVTVDDARHPTWGVNVDTVDSAYTGLPNVNLNQRNRAVSEALLKVNDQKINLGVMMGEARKTLSMVTNRIRTLVAFYKALRRGNLRYAYYVVTGRSIGVSSGRTAAELYLELQYGWRPLIDDVYGGAEQIRKGLRENSLLFSVERTVTDPVNPEGFFGPTGSLITEGTAKESYRVKLWGCVTDEFLSGASTLGLINPATIAWELTPYSFVIDWLLPIGNWLDSLTASIGVKFIAGCGTYLRTADVEAVRVKLPNNYTAVKPPRVRMQSLVMDRVTYGSWPWALPYIKSPFSASHVTSAVALLSSARR